MQTCDCRQQGGFDHPELPDCALLGKVGNSRLLEICPGEVRGRMISKVGRDIMKTSSSGSRRALLAGAFFGSLCIVGAAAQQSSDTSTPAGAPAAPPPAAAAPPPAAAAAPLPPGSPLIGRPDSNPAAAKLA